MMPLGSMFVTWSVKSTLMVSLPAPGGMYLTVMVSLALGMMSKSTSSSLSLMMLASHLIPTLTSPAESTGMESKDEDVLGDCFYDDIIIFNQSIQARHIYISPMQYTIPIPPQTHAWVNCRHPRQIDTIKGTTTMLGMCMCVCVCVCSRVSHPPQPQCSPQ